MDWGFGSVTDSEGIRPDFPTIRELNSQNDESHSKIRVRGLGSTENMDDCALDVEIKEEVGELFMGRSIDVENVETIFPTGLILIHDQPAPTATTSDGQTETHLLTYTPVYMDDKESPSYLQTSTPKSSIIRTNHSEIQFVHQAIQPTPYEGTRFPGRLHGSRNSTFKDPLEISPPNVGNNVESNPETIDTIHTKKMRHECTLCKLRFATLLGLANHRVRVHRSHATQKDQNPAPCHLSISVPTHQRIIEGHHKNVLSSQNVELTDPLAISPTKLKEIVQSDAECTLKEIQLETILKIPCQEKRYKCTLCELKFVNNNERDVHVIGVHEDTETRNAEFLTSLYAPMNKASPDTVEITPGGQKPSSSEFIVPLETQITLTPNSLTSPDFKRMEVKIRENRSRRQKYENDKRTRERRRQNETPDERSARLAADAERKRNSSAKETQGQRQTRLTTTAERRRKCLANETPEERSARLTANAERQKQRLANETPDQRAKRRTADAERRRKRSANETLEQRNARRARQAERMKIYMADGTQEERTARLAITRDLNFVQCKYCEKSLAPRSLKEHLLRHHAKAEDRTFKCDHCEKTFALECHQKSHMLTHSMEKRFICDKCGKGYKDKKGLTNHIIFKHRYDDDVQEKYWQE